MHGKISRGRVGYTLKFFRARVSGYTWKNSRGRVPPKCGAPGVGWLRFSYSYGELCFTNYRSVLSVFPIIVSFYRTLSMFMILSIF